MKHTALLVTSNKFRRPGKGRDPSPMSRPSREVWVLAFVRVMQISEAAKQ